MGIQFNNLSNILLHADGEKIQFFDNKFQETFCHVNDHPLKLKKMVLQVSHCRKFMKENLIEAGSSSVRNRGDDISRLPVLQRWFKTGRAICFWLSDGCMQINWFEVCHITGLVWSISYRAYNSLKFWYFSPMKSSYFVLAWQQ